MAQCFDNWKNAYVSCSSSRAVYIAVGIIIPLSIFIVLVLIVIYRRYRLKRNRREQQNIGMNTIVPIENSDEQQAPYNYSYPPNYTSLTSNPYDKPPSYEQTVQQLSEVNQTTDDTAAILPVTTMTSSSSAAAMTSHAAARSS